MPGVRNGAASRSCRKQQTVGNSWKEAEGRDGGFAISVLPAEVLNVWRRW
ncbi:MAG: hypothetical protein M3360_11770 [Actinomycetota bacterium]|nr:hypothetical protein [Actinomycetota bacterium]